MQTPDDTTDVVPPRRRRPGFAVVRVTLGLILLAAAGLKAHQLATEPVLSIDIFSYRWSLAVQVQFELVLGLWLLGGMHRRLLWLVSTVCFALFALVSLYKALAGQASCGCFGTVHVSPWYTLALDVAATGALILFRPDLRLRGRVRLYWLRLAAVVVLALAAGVPTGIAIARYEPGTITEEGEIIGDHKRVMLEPDDWPGKQFILLRYIDVGDKLAAGDWTVVLFDHDCPGCDETIPKYVRLAREGNAALGRLALIEVPPYAPPSWIAGLGRSTCLFGKLTDKLYWYVWTPAIVILKDGVVTEVTDSHKHLAKLAGAAGDGRSVLPPEGTKPGRHWAFWVGPGQSSLSAYGGGGPARAGRPGAEPPGATRAPAYPRRQWLVRPSR